MNCTAHEGGVMMMMMMMVVGGCPSKLFFLFYLNPSTVPVCSHMMAYHEISNRNHNACDAVSKKKKKKSKAKNRTEPS
jgi:hypothetical protein